MFSYATPYFTFSSKKLELSPALAEYASALHARTMVVLINYCTCCLRSRPVGTIVPLHASKRIHATVLLVREPYDCKLMAAKAPC